MELEIRNWGIVKNPLSFPPFRDGDKKREWIF